MLTKPKLFFKKGGLFGLAIMGTSKGFKLNKVDNLNNLKLITQWSDRPITKKLFNQKPKCISNWYASHVDYNHDNLHPIPLGLSGDYSPKNLLKKHFVDFYKLETQPNKENLL